VTVLDEAAAIYDGQGDSLESERLLLRAVALDPASAETCRALARLYQGAGMIAEERVVRRRLVEIEPQNLANYLDLAKACAQLGEPESAEATLKLALAMSPNSVDVYATLAQFYLQEGKARKARWFAQEAVRREPTAEGYLFLASTCRLLDDQAAAEAAMARARKLAPDDPRFQGPAPQRP
jgi:protein O-GlcNAc transferase